MSSLYYPVLLAMLGLYVAAISYEAVISFRRLRPKAHKDLTGYVDSTWEITHTLLIFSFITFTITFSAVLPDIVGVLVLPLLLTGVAFVARAILYLVIFYVRPEKNQTINLLDYGFAVSHVAIIIGVVVSVTLTAIRILELQASPDLSFFGTYLPGLFVVLIASLVPVYRLFRQS